MTTALSRLAVPELYVRQKRELAEFFGFETRNKYAISTPDRHEVFYAAEQRSGLLGMLAIYLLGHWRSFDIAFFDDQRAEAFRAHHPFRFFFQRLEVSAHGRPIGALQQRFSVFTKRFDVLDANGALVLEMKSGLLKPWTFPFFRGERQVAVIEKKWSGVLTEMFTDKDNFRVAFEDPALTDDQRMLVLAAAVFVDLQYFERKAQS
ncbi:MAG: hypothetical protein INH41_06765 [Myxococcaceae bacterium]|nr:hypothetical protein [Myxococcaceae bacterium]MCA3012091.1 hypothetical protein [Myxococcaceae bacterium]